MRPLLVLLLALPAVAGDPAPPAPRESFRFVVFGDRTGGRPAGLAVLDAAVDATNRLDPDFTMTVGDLVQGYNERAQWLEQAAEYKRHMSRLARPWYPVAGNHDVYGRGKDREKGHLAEYREHFGPLYYSFDYRWAHFVVLFSDEKLAFGRPGTQDMSPEQIAWLKQDLAGTKAKQVFVFLHHPRWIYRDTNWNDVHAVLAGDGRVRAVFGGHVHVYRDDGVRDGIHYYVLAVTGGAAGVLKTPASLHHINHVTVTRGDFRVAVLPIGAVVGADLAMGAEVDRLWAMRDRGWLAVEGSAAMELGASRESSFDVVVTNPEKAPVSYEVVLRHDGTWETKPRGFGGHLAAGERKVVSVTATAPAFLGKADLKVHATLHIDLKSGLTHPVHMTRAVPTDIHGLPAERLDLNSVLQLDGKSGVRVDLPELPEEFTVECWVKGKPPKGRAAVVSRAESAGFGIWWSFQGQALPYGMVGFPKGYETVGAKEPWEFGQWTHLALCVGAEEITFFVGGEPQATRPRPAKRRRRSDRSLYVGGDPDRRNRLSYGFSGAIDEVRISAGARYTKRFEPARYFERDGQTVLLLHFDAQVERLFPDDSGRFHHGWPVGNTVLAAEKR